MSAIQATASWRPDQNDGRITKTPETKRHGGIMTVKRMDNVGIVVEDIDDTLARLRKRGAVWSDDDDVPHVQVMLPH